MNYQLIFYVPEANLEEVKQALFELGVGKLGNYEQTCWQSLGRGQFRPLEDANPAIGKKQELNFVNEYKVEILCSDELIHLAVQKLIEVHPYEEPAYAVIRLEPF
ncbi:MULTISPECIES: P-II family nitrogen regulator [Legionella]|uniref:NGG1p interacting factor NIF3 n=1 Tax=Legionella septentrionalis TaxID=2498109 RepID=A0A3S0VMG8_9GAMM|nr:MULTISPECIES: P-II family nitrogen regulator [Legionella]MCP0913263.1 NGG1p interacting factor NIF3 [Legionella sp. 27cVA30]RUQ82079.1 NGG1p interacting factor NIF3 [Legionella septentrionalis]RUQ95542.1 NGG1p interacting factor NIF3 [Legionella septentrionalis]RUR08941.1 NGG1p interacting factor NIF3 [Legionella septentrionalis]RUR14726.1 NGG1p interacting factor NIF3 [Legionella septentrionalis]